MALVSRRVGSCTLPGAKMLQALTIPLLPRKGGVGVREGGMMTQTLLRSCCKMCPRGLACGAHLLAA